MNEHESPNPPDGLRTFGWGALFFLSIVFAAARGLHDERQPTILIWLVVGMVATWIWIAERREAVTYRRLRRGGTLLIVSAWILGSLFVFAPEHDPHGPVSRQVRCASNLRQIGQTMLLYANDHGGLYPDRPEELFTIEGVGPEIFVCPASDDTPPMNATTRAMSDALASGGHFSYVYLGKGITSQWSSPSLVLAYEPPSHHDNLGAGGINVLFGDGHVEFIEQPKADQLIRDLKAGKTPPTAKH